MNLKKPTMVMSLNLWSFTRCGELILDLDIIADRMKKSAIGAVNWGPFNDVLAQWLLDNDIKFAGGLVYRGQRDIEDSVRCLLQMGDGPINCQLGYHDSSTEEAVQWSIELMELSEKLGANIHVEAHRDTATETPEKLDAIIDGYFAQKGRRLKVNFDYSHPAIVKHLLPEQFSERLITRPDYLQDSDLLHLRPFNGHHCQVPITDGHGNLSREFENYLPFARDVIKNWLSGPNITNRELWIVPELGPYDRLGYGLSCFPDITQDVFVLAEAIQKVWDQCIAEKFPQCDR